MSKLDKARKIKHKRQRRREARKTTITLPGGETAPQRPAQGARHDIDREPQRTALQARARHTGCTVEEARDVLAADDIGRCIRDMRPDDRDRRNLLSVWQGISAAWANYAGRVLSIQPNPQAASLPMLAEAMQTDPSLRVDLRTGDERDEAAKRAWAAWQADFNRLPQEQAVTIAAAATGISAPLWDVDNLRPTRHGALAVKALAALHEARSGGRA
jgi:hypothetical protein